MSVHLVSGSDPLLRGRVVDEVVAELLEGDDASLALEDITVPGRAGAGEDGPAASAAPGGAEAREAAIALAIQAASSPPFMTARRVVVVRDIGALTTSDVAPLVRYLEDPMPTTALVLVAGGGTTAPALAKQLQASGVDRRAPASEKTVDVLADALKAAGLAMRPEAAKAVVAHLGDDSGRTVSLVDVLAAAHGEGASLSLADVTPYLGEAGAVPGYQLTNAIEVGDTPAALEVLSRLLTVTSPRQPRPMHPLQVMGLLHSHYRRLLRLDDPSIRSAADAVAALGGKIKEYPAKKALAQARALGVDGIRRAFDLLAQADLDLKGARGIPEGAVMELLVARLAALGGSRRTTRAG